MKEINILITNDDGIESEGLKNLANKIKEIGKVWVIAPERERSTCSHSMTLTSPVTLTQISQNEFTCSGTPADCVYLGLYGVMDKKPDFVLSGINRGANLGTDIYYSGTVAAAREASLRGIRSIAFSLVNGNDFISAAQHCAVIVKNILKMELPSDVLINVNVPSAKVRGIKIAFPGKRKYPELAHKLSINGDESSYLIGGGLPVEDAEIHGSDGYWTSNGWITLSPIKMHIEVDKNIVQKLAAIYP